MFHPLALWSLYAQMSTATMFWAFSFGAGAPRATPTLQLVSYNPGLERTARRGQLSLVG